MPPNDAGARAESLDDFRVTAPAEISALLKVLCDRAVLLNISGPAGSAVVARLWTLDVARGVISFSADAHDPQLQSLLDGDEAVVVGHLDNVKLQFEVHNLMLVRDGASSALRCSFPRELWRFQRRHGYRVRPLTANGPTATLRHPALAEMALVLRVLDLSIGGCALLLPATVPPIDPGLQINGVQLQLDADTRISLTLRLLHVTAIDPEAGGVRLGCELVRPSSESERALQRYIDQTQKRRRLMALD